MVYMKFNISGIWWHCKNYFLTNIFFFVRELLRWAIIIIRMMKYSFNGNQVGYMGLAMFEFFK